MKIHSCYFNSWEHITLCIEEELSINLDFTC